EEEEDQFFDTRDFLSCTGSFRSHDDGNNYLSSDDNDDDDDGVDDNDQESEPAEKERAVSLWSMIKDNIGKDLGKICLPVYFNEPISSLQKLSGYASTNGRLCKPFNPLLGETYEADFPDKGLRFISEKKCHWSQVTTSIYNLILGKVYCDHHGTMKIEGNGKYSCKLKFKEHSMIDRNPHQVQGIVEEKSSGKTVATLLGKWDDSMHYIIKSGGHTKLAEPQLLWKRSKPSKFPTRYNLTRFAITLNELTPGLEVPTNVSIHNHPSNINNTSSLSSN
ncbi:Oxysterol-binding protein-related protein 1A, partial [Linum perenne]